MAQSVFSEKSNVERSVTLYTALPEEIVIAPGITGRKEDTDITALAADIFQNGQNTPVLFRKDDAGKPVLVYGHRRVAAIDYINKHMLSAGQEKFRVQGKYERLNEIEAFTAAVSENRFRKDTTAVDDAFNIEQFQKRFKLSVEAIAGIYFPEAQTLDAKEEAVRWVKVRAGLVELADEAKQAVRDGRLTVTAAAEMAKLPKDNQRKVVAENTSTLKGKSRIKVSDVKAQKPAPAPRKAVAPAKAAAPSGPAPKVPSSVYAAAEELACVAAGVIRAIDAYLEDTDSDKAENGLIAANNALLVAQTAYRKLVPFREAVGKAA